MTKVFQSTPFVILTSAERLFEGRTTAAAWFETALTGLLTMTKVFQSTPFVILTSAERLFEGRTTAAAWFETALTGLLTMTKVFQSTPFVILRRPEGPSRRTHKSPKPQPGMRTIIFR